MLGPQVAVSIDDAAAAHPRCQHGAAFSEEAPLQAIDASDQGGRKPEPRIGEDAAVRGQAPRPLGEVRP
jgi:hypothetical protein